MSARKAESTNLSGLSIHTTQCLTLPESAVRIRKNGIEFRSDHPISPWTEMTLSLQGPRDSKKVHCTGVIVACNGNRESGYTVSMLFTNLSPQSQVRLLAYS